MSEQTAHVQPITGLRALAVLAVLLFHLDATWMPGGFSGVDMFFVISGFVVAHSVMAMPAESYGAFLRQFYRRRIVRILPAVLVFVAVALCLSVLFIPFTSSTYSIERIGAAAAVGLSNFALLDASGGYFSTLAEFNPFLHTWSLAVEEQFYVLFALFGWPLLIKRDTLGHRIAVVMVVIATAASLAFCAYQMGQSRSFAFYMLPTRFWELSMGLLLRLGIESALVQNGIAKLSPSREPITMAAFAGLVWALWSTSEAGFPYPGAIVPCVFTALMIACVWSWRATLVARLLSNRFIVWIGLISYSLYLWHWGVIVFMRWTVGVDSLSQKLVALLLTFAISAASYYGVERLIRHSGAIKNWKAADFFPRFGAATAAVVALSIAGQAVKPDVGLAAANDVNVWSPYTQPPERRPCVASINVERAGNAQIIGFEAPCLRDDAPKLFVLGDSHAAAYQRMLWRVAETGDWNVVLYSLNSCGYINFRDREPDADCAAFTDRVVQTIRAEAQPGDAIFLPALHTSRFWNHWTVPDRILEPYAVVEKRIAQNRVRMEHMADIGIDIILEDAKPVAPTVLFRCADWFNRDQAYCRGGPNVSRDLSMARMKPLRDAIRTVSAGLPNVSVWDPSRILCDADSCDGYRDGKPLYFDTDHLTAFGNELLLPDFRAKLSQLAAPAPSHEAMPALASSRRGTR